MLLSPSFNAVTTKGSEVPKIMGYLKYPGGGEGQGAVHWPRLPSAGTIARDTEGTQLCPGAGLGQRKGKKQEPRALVYG